jgi:hypothetical protein
MPRMTIPRVLATVVIMSTMGGSKPIEAGMASGSAVLAEHGLGIYDWRHAGTEASLGATDQRLQFLLSRGFRTIYLFVNDYLVAWDRRESTSRWFQLVELEREFRQFNAAARRVGLTVHAVVGNPTWADATKRYLGVRLIRLISDYNANVAANQRFAGVQFDIEPYRRPEFARESTHILSAYLHALQDIAREFQRERLHPWNAELQLGFATPFSFDGSGELPSTVSFNGIYKPVSYHLIDIVGKLADAYVVVMSYRNFSLGKDGTISHAENEFRYANSVAAKCRIIVGQEFGDFQPAKVSFHGRGRTAFTRAALQVAQAFGRYPQFGGLSVNDVDAFIAASD